MNAFVPYLAALHQQDLLEQAEFARRAKRATDSHQDVSLLRRSVGRLLTSAAKSIDPAVQVERVAPLSSGRGADMLPAC